MTTESHTPALDPALQAGNHKPLAGYQPLHFLWKLEAGVATITLNRPDRKNPLTFDSYVELRDLFSQLKYATDVHAVVVTGAGVTAATLRCTCTSSRAMPSEIVSQPASRAAAISA